MDTDLGLRPEETPQGSGLNDFWNDSEEVMRGLGDFYSQPDDVTRGLSLASDFDSFPFFGDFYREDDNITRGVTLLPGDFYREDDDIVRGVTLLPEYTLANSAWQDYVGVIERSFDEVDDNLLASSFEAYRNNICVICQQGNEKWDLWSSCRHLFCQDCSSEMLGRGMSCPLCRTSSTIVVRGNCFKTQSTDDGPQRTCKQRVPEARKARRSRRAATYEHNMQWQKQSKMLLNQSRRQQWYQQRSQHVLQFPRHSSRRQ